MKKVISVLVIWLLFVPPVVVLLFQAFVPQWNMGANQVPLGYKYWGLPLGKLSTLLEPLGISAFYSLVVVLVSLVLVVPAARSLTHTRLGKSLIVETLLLFPAFVPPLTTALGNHRWMSVLGLTDSMFSIVIMLTFYSYPYLLRTMLAGYRLLDPLQSLAAKNLGAGYFRTLFGIELAQLLPSIFAGSTMVFLAAYSDYLIVALFGGGLVPSFSAILLPVASSSNHAWAAILALVFLSFPLLILASIDVILHMHQSKRHRKVEV